MNTRLDLTLRWLDSAYATLAEALFVPPGGFRSILGTLKHTAGWSHVYRSYAFDAAPIAWNDLPWPYGLRDILLQSEAYLTSLIAWMSQSHQLWQQDLRRLRDEQLDQLRPVHWGDRLPLGEIVRLIAHHHVYHAIEI